MCVLCQANSLELAIELLTDDISIDGYAVASTPPTDDRPRWVYTVGLEQTFDHPELLIVTCDTNEAIRALRAVVCEVEGDRHFLPGDLVVTSQGEARIVEATAAQHQHPLLPMRYAYDLSIGHLPSPWPPLQVLVPRLTCRLHPLDTWRIDRRFPLLAAPARPNRAERRRATRREKRRR